MMAAGTGSSAMISDADTGRMQQYDQLFSRVRYVEDRKKPVAAVQNPEETKQAAAPKPNKTQPTIS